MDRHPAGCDPSSFRALPAPPRSSSRIPPASDQRISPRYQQLARVPGLESALATLQVVACDVVQPVSRYNRYTYLNRFNAAALQLADVFIAHVNQLRHQLPRPNPHRKSLPTHPYSQNTFTPSRNKRSCDESEDSDLILRKRSSRLANKRRRPRYLSSDEDDYAPYGHRLSRPRRSKEIRTNLNDDLAYDLMARREPSPEKPQHLSQEGRSAEVESSEEEDEIDYNDITLPLVRPLPFVRRRPLTSDNNSLTPFIEDEDDTTDTEQRRRDHARRSLKTVVYGPGNAEFTEKEILAVFPWQWLKRRLKCDALALTSQCPPTAHADTSSKTLWKPPIIRLGGIPKDMSSKYVNGTYLLSPEPLHLSDSGIFPEPNGFGGVPGASEILAKQRYPSSDRDTRDGDSSKASPATCVQSGSSTTGSPRAKKPGIQNGDIDIELLSPLSSLNDSHRERQKGTKDTEIARQTNGKIHHTSRTSLKPWKDVAPYGRLPQRTQLQQAPLEGQNVDALGKSGTVGVLHSTPHEKDTPDVQDKLPVATETNLKQRQVPQTTLKQSPLQPVRPQSQKVVQAPPLRTSQALRETMPVQNRSQSERVRTAPPPASQVIVRSAPPQQVRQPQKHLHAPPTQSSLSQLSNQVANVSRGVPVVANMRLPAQMSVQPQMNLQPQVMIRNVVPVQSSTQQTGFPVQHTLQVPQYGVDARLVPQWPLQNAAFQQAQGAWQLPTGHVAVNNIVTPAPPGTVAVQDRFVLMQTGVPITTNALVPACTTARPDLLRIEPNGSAMQAAAEPASPATPSPPPAPPGGDGTRTKSFNSQFQEQFQKRYDQMYPQRYQEHMKTLSKEDGRNNWP